MRHSTRPGQIIRDRRWRWSLFVAVLVLVSACQTTMSIEDAKQVTASFGSAAFVPPPRTITDITAILDQQPRADPEAAAAARARADQLPPDPADPATLVRFYHDRGLAAREIGRARQEVEDLTTALNFVPEADGVSELRILSDLSRAEVKGGNFTRALQLRRRAVARVPQADRGWLLGFYSNLSKMYASGGDLTTAEATLRELSGVFAESRRWRDQSPEAISRRRAWVARAQASVLVARGRYIDAEGFQREAIATSTGLPTRAERVRLEEEIAYLAAILSRQGRLLEAESEARRALLGVLSKRGRYSTDTAQVLRALQQVLYEQGRYGEAETLARAVIDIYEKTGSAPESARLGRARAELAEALGAQGRWREALGEYEAIRVGLAGDPQSAAAMLRGHVGWAVALLQTGQADQALDLLNVALERNRRVSGEAHRQTAQIRGLLASAYAGTGDQRRALREFTEATRILLARGPGIDEEGTTRAAADQRLTLVLASYLRLLAEIQGTVLAGETGVDAAAEAFRLADVARGRSVQRALDASSARAAARTPALADLIRREQDARKQVSALQGALANVLSAPTDQENPEAVQNLRAQITVLARARQRMGEQIEREFPAYAQLLNPSPATIDQVRATLRSDEALVSTFVTSDRTFVWAIPRTGPVAFRTAPLGEQALDQAVTHLRKALDPGARTLGEIPEFDLTGAYELYRTLLEPVKGGWGEARSLLVVGHGPLGQLPLSLLPTGPVILGPESRALFSRYRDVPWLVRSHAVTVLPSVSALVTLRARPAGDPARRPFVGFGDPYFNIEQAARVERRTSTPPERESVTIRGVPIALRSSPQTQGANSSQLGQLPPLPDTAEEIRGIALALDADLTRDVIIGTKANERTVRTMNLSGYRVLAFATHGLVPGDLDGLTQPALALTAPEVAQVEGDGLLTMEKILTLRLDADWVVLSACNTASGHGAGSEAVSGLGRAFFYAGARALLVSNWPVETTSARVLTTELFRRQRASSGLTRAQALRQTLNWVIDSPGFVDPRTNQVVFSYAHPLFWAPFTLVGDGGASNPSGP